MNQKIPSKTKKKADQYNDPSHNYLHYWDGRDYEDASERLAIKKLLKGKHFKHAADIGGGYGRLCVFLENYADKVTLAEPSQQQLDIAKDFLKGHSEVDRKLTQADALDFKDSELDLITMVRVMHHLPDPSVEFSEIARCLEKDGTFILEIASFGHFKNRFKHFIRGKRMPIDPVDIRSAKNRNKDEIAFVNHNPNTVIKQLAHAGMKVEKILSVSNLRSTTLKKVMPKSVMLSIENVLQRPLGRTFFGPSIWLLVRKAK